jgi:ACR3 family arsenite efflux pump ArsB
MNAIEKLEPILLALGAFLGLALGKLTLLGPAFGLLVQPLLMLMLLGVFWDIPLKDLKKGFTDLKFAGTAIFLNFVWIPILGWLLALGLLGEHQDLLVGFIMLLVTPCTDWYLIFTAIARGNVPLSASILPLNLILQLLLLPVFLWFFGGLQGQTDPLSLLGSVVFVLFIPLVLARFLVYICRFKEGVKRVFERLTTKSRFWYLWLAVVCMFTGQGENLINRPDVLVRLLAPVLLFFALNFIIVRLIGDLLHFSYRDSVSLSLTTLARNSPIALTVAVGAFPDRPLIALTLIIGPLIELPVLAIIAKILLWLGRRRRIPGFF